MSRISIKLCALSACPQVAKCNQVKGLSVCTPKTPAQDISSLSLAFQSTHLCVQNLKEIAGNARYWEEEMEGKYYPIKRKSHYVTPNKQDTRTTPPNTPMISRQEKEGKRKDKAGDLSLALLGARETL